MISQAMAKSCRLYILEFKRRKLLNILTGKKKHMCSFLVRNNKDVPKPGQTLKVMMYINCWR